MALETAAGLLGSFVGGLDLGSPEGSGGADPYCKGMGSSDPETIPQNSNVAGAPPGFRKRWARQTSRDGVKRIVDRICDGEPVHYGGSWWMMGKVEAGRVLPELDPFRTRWVEVTKSGRPIRIPGQGAVEGTTATTSTTATSSTSSPGEEVPQDSVSRLEGILHDLGDVAGQTGEALVEGGLGAAEQTAAGAAQGTRIDEERRGPSALTVVAVVFALVLVLGLGFAALR